MLVTALAPKIGYDAAAKIAKAAHAKGTTLRAEAVGRAMSAKPSSTISVDPKKMIGPE